MPGRRLALIIACSDYKPPLSPLLSANTDASNLDRVLSDPSLGNFSTEILLNKPSHEVAYALENFLSKCQVDDFVLIHFSGHGLKDNDGKLYFALTNTEIRHLFSTAISSIDVNKLLIACRAKQKILLLDCCYGGAYLKGLLPRSATTASTLKNFSDGQGFVIITASDALQYAFEGNIVNGKATSSVFTQILVDGIETGKADQDEDGFVEISELYKYIQVRISVERPEQKPEINNFRVQGDIYIAKTQNIKTELILTCEEAKIGGKRVISIVGHDITVNIPENSLDGSKIRYNETAKDSAHYGKNIVISLRVLNSKHPNKIYIIVSSILVAVLVISATLMNFYKKSSRPKKISYLIFHLRKHQFSM